MITWRATVYLRAIQQTQQTKGTRVHKKNKSKLHPRYNITKITTTKKITKINKNRPILPCLVHLNSIILLSLISGTFLDEMSTLVASWGRQYYGACCGTSPFWRFFGLWEMDFLTSNRQFKKFRRSHFLIFVFCRELTSHLFLGRLPNNSIFMSVFMSGLKNTKILFVKKWDKKYPLRFL